MSRRNQSRRRRTYGRRQHEVRERRPVNGSPLDWAADLDPDVRDSWLADAADHTATLGDGQAGYAR